MCLNFLFLTGMVFQLVINCTSQNRFHIMNLSLKNFLQSPLHSSTKSTDNLSASFKFLLLKQLQPNLACVNQSSGFVTS